MPPALGTWGLNHWTTREVPKKADFFFLRRQILRAPITYRHKKGKAIYELMGMLITWTVVIISQVYI